MAENSLKEYNPLNTELLPKKAHYRVDEVARYYGIEERTVRLHIEHGNLIAVKVGGSVRIPLDSLLGFARMITRPLA